MLPVFALLQEVLVPPVVGEVKQDPGAVCNHTGVGLTHLVGIIDRRTVIRAFNHLTAKVWPLVEPQLAGTAINLWTNRFSRQLSKQSYPSWPLRSLCKHWTAFFRNNLQASTSQQSLPSSRLDRTWRCRWRPSTAGCRRTPLGWGRTGSPCSWVSHRWPTHRSPPGWSCSGWSVCAGRHTRCCSCSSGPGTSSLRKKWSVGRNTSKPLIECTVYSSCGKAWDYLSHLDALQTSFFPAAPSKYLFINKMCRVRQKSLILKWGRFKYQQNSPVLFDLPLLEPDDDSLSNARWHSKRQRVPVSCQRPDWLFYRKTFVSSLCRVK